MFAVFNKQKQLKAKDVQKAREYIEKYWPKLTRHEPVGDESLIGLPNPYIVPAHSKGDSFHFNEMYYWDTYFVIQGLLAPEHKDLVVGMVDNLLHMYRQLKVIPNASRTYLAGRSQPPFLTSMVWDVFETFHLPLRWLDQAMDIAQSEYYNVWLGTQKPNIRLMYKGLSRYYDVNQIHDLAEAESGWDMTTRFNRKALDYLPVDLNSLLYKYEKDFAKYYRLKKDDKAATAWERKATRRADAMNKLMWSNTRGYFMDYNYVKLKRSSISSLASFYPLWAGIASEAQAKQMVRALRVRFEQKGGLTATDMPFAGKNITPIPTQWAYPNGWAPLHFIVVKALQRYGYVDDAVRIAHKWMNTNLQWFNKHGEFLEKYNVARPSKPPARGLYPSQIGFGWTNAVFERLCQDFID